MENNILFYGMTFLFLLFTIIIISSYFYKLVDKHLNYKRRQSYVDRHINYVATLDYYMEKAFDIIYKDRILIYSIEGTKPTDEDIRKNSIDFSKLTMDLLGPMLVEEFVFLYGNEETLYMVMVEYFNTRAETDEIKQESINHIMEGGAENENAWDVL